MSKTGITLYQWDPIFMPYSNQTCPLPYDNRGSPANVLASAGTAHALVDGDIAPAADADAADSAILTQALPVIEALTGQKVVMVVEEPVRALPPPPPQTPAPLPPPVPQPMAMVCAPPLPPVAHKNGGDADSKEQPPLPLSTLAKKIALPACMRVTEEPLSAVQRAAATPAAQHVRCSNCNTAVEAGDAVAVAARLMEARGKELYWRVFRDIACRRCSEALRAEWAANNKK
jgi:hypothetical protein